MSPVSPWLPAISPWLPALILFMSVHLADHMFTFSSPSSTVCLLSLILRRPFVYFLFSFADRLFTFPLLLPAHILSHSTSVLSLWPRSSSLPSFSSLLALLPLRRALRALPLRRALHRALALRRALPLRCALPPCSSSLPCSLVAN
jgi:hypothetical protein